MDDYTQWYQLQKDVRYFFSQKYDFSILLGLSQVYSLGLGTSLGICEFNVLIREDAKVLSFTAVDVKVELSPVILRP